MKKLFYSSEEIMEYYFPNHYEEELRKNMPPKEETKYFVTKLIDDFKKF